MMNRLEETNASSDATHHHNLYNNWKYLYPLYRAPSPNKTRHMYDVQSLLPPELPRDPRLWSRQQVQTWVRWCQEEFDLPAIDGDAHFTMNGKALCLLLRSDFTERSPRAGDILYNVVQILLREASDTHHHSRYNGLRVFGYANGVIGAGGIAGGGGGGNGGGGGGGGSGGNDLVSGNGETGGGGNSWPVVSSDYHSLAHVLHQPRHHVQVSPSTSGVESTVTLSPAPSTDSRSDGSPRLHGMSPQHPAKGAKRADDSVVSDYEDSGTDSPIPRPTLMETELSTSKKSDSPTANDTMAEPITNGRLLWDFLHQLLNDPSQRYISCIRWFSQENGIFKITDPNGLARLWGLQKNHLNMNFDKMSRALRYYYRVNILRKVQGERHCYQFLRQPTELKNFKQRALLNKLRMSEKPLDMSIHGNVVGIIKTEDTQ